MKIINTKKNILLYIFLFFYLLFNTNCDLLVRSPNELKSQFISMSINNKIILIY